MGWGSAQSLRGRGSHVQMRIQPEIERNPASGQAISASELFDLTGSKRVGLRTPERRRIELIEAVRSLK
jgi:hypothetical protein